ncbi:MAG: 30S ribosome-binding factor RbfA [Pseudomonadales bacterium]|jgi:ribosome-binding factor A|nr:30S ribosome-binding factor RbfA [Pseudomonadales bacterium]
MPRPSNRLDRIGDQLKQELAVLIRDELRDPRLGMVSVIDAKVSRDLAHAVVYFTALNADAAEVSEVLNKASGYLRSLLAKRLNLRSTPKLRFAYDESIEHGRELSALIDKAMALEAPPDDEGSDP